MKASKYFQLKKIILNNRASRKQRVEAAVDLVLAFQPYEPLEDVAQTESL